MTFYDAHQRPVSRFDRRAVRLLRTLRRERLAIGPVLLCVLAAAITFTVMVSH